MVGARLDGRAVQLAELRCRPTREILGLVEAELRGASRSSREDLIADAGYGQLTRAPAGSFTAIHLTIR